MKKVYLLLALLTFCQAGFSINFIGGNGQWDNPSNWDTGKVPNGGDTVYIDNVSQVYIDGPAEAAKVYVYGTLAIEAAGKLKVVNNGGLEVILVSGALVNHGYIYAYNKDDCIRVYDFMENYGTIELESEEGSALLSSGTTENQGSIVVLYGSRGIENEAVFDNHGHIQIKGAADYGIYNRWNATFVNASSGDINIEEAVFYGIYNLELFKNFGNIDIIAEDYYGINNSGNFRNLGSGYIHIEGQSNSSAGISNSTNGLFVNQAEIRIRDIYDGIRNYDTFRNRFGGQLTLENTQDRAISNSFSTTFLNRKATIDIINQNFGGGELYNLGDFTNDRCGHIHTSRRIYLWSSGASFTNNAFLVSSYNNPHTLNNSFYNNGIIKSESSTAFGSLSGANNNGILIEPITSQAYVGQPIANALTLGSLANATVMGWYTDAGLSTPAGIYNAANNTFTPFSAAVGITTLYIEIDLGYDINCSPQVFEVELNWPVQPLRGGPTTFSGGQPVGEWSVFPNPATNYASISGLPKGLATVQLFNAQGQALKTFNVEDARQRQLDLNLEGLPAGMYWIKAGPEVMAIVVK